MSTNYHTAIANGAAANAATFNAPLGQLDAQIKTNEDAIGALNFDPAALSPQGRLTLSSTLAVTASDVTAATAVYYLPFNGSFITIYDGSSWQVRAIPASLNVSVPATTNTNYDVFAAYVGSALVLELVAWSSGTARATALTTQDGIYVKSGDATRRYVGTIRTTGVSGQCEDSETKRFCWNAYNRVDRKLFKTDLTGSWTYSTNAFRQANGSAANQVEVITGLAEETVDITVMCGAQGGVSAIPGIGVDSTSTDSSDMRVSAGAAFAPILAKYVSVLSVGYHYVAWLENGGGTPTTTFFSNLGGVKGGINGRIIA